MIEPTKEDCAYAAGFFDGEGTVFIAEDRGRKEARGPIYNMHVTACQVDPDPIHWLQHRWGGTIVRRSARANTRPCWIWNCFAREALAFLRDVRPYLMVKADEADVAIEFQEGRFQPGQRGLSDEDRARQRQAREMLMELKRDKDKILV
jgi:hypothetical protein